MSEKLKTVIGIVFFVAFIGAVWIAYTMLTKQYKPDTSNPTQESVAESENESIRKTAPDFTVYDTNGNEVQLSDYAGKPVVLNFWASWCSPCRSEMPHFNEVYAQFKDDVVFLMVDMVDGQRETQEKGRNFVTSQQYSFPVYFDNKQSAADAYQIMAIPATYFIDANGTIIKSYEGAIDKNSLLAGINAIKSE